MATQEQRQAPQQPQPQPRSQPQPPEPAHQQPVRQHSERHLFGMDDDEQMPEHARSNPPPQYTNQPPPRYEMIDPVIVEDPDQDRSPDGKMMKTAKWLRYQYIWAFAYGCIVCTCGMSAMALEYHDKPSRKRPKPGE